MFLYTHKGLSPRRSSVLHYFRLINDYQMTASWLIAVVIICPAIVLITLATWWAFTKLSRSSSSPARNPFALPATWNRRNSESEEDDLELQRRVPPMLYEVQTTADQKPKSKDLNAANQWAETQVSGYVTIVSDGILTLGLSCLAGRIHSGSHERHASCHAC